MWAATKVPDPYMSRYTGHLTQSKNQRRLGGIIIPDILAHDLLTERQVVDNNDLVRTAKLLVEVKTMQPENQTTISRIMLSTLQSIDELIRSNSTTRGVVQGWV